MGDDQIQVLLIAMNPAILLLVNKALSEKSPDPERLVQLTAAPSLADGLRLIRERHFDAILLDLVPAGDSGIEPYVQVQGAAPDTPVILLVNKQNEGIGRLAVERGGQDFLVKNQAGWGNLQRSIRYVIEQQHQRASLRTSEDRYLRMVEQQNGLLSDRESQYRAVIATSGDGFLMSDLSGRILEVNHAYTSRSGYSATELLSMSVQDLVPPDRRAVVSTRIETIFREGHLRFESIHRAKDGALWQIEVTASYWPIGGGRIFNFLRDITERKNAELALAQSEAQYRLLAENMSDTVWLMDMNLKTCYTSPSILRLRGYTLEELNTVPLRLQMTAESYQRFMAEFTRLTAPENIKHPSPQVTKSIELGFARKDGSTLWNEVAITLIRNEQGLPVNLLVTGSDVTERKHAEEELKKSEAHLRESEERLSLALSASQMGVWEWDMRTDSVFWSPECTKIFGPDNFHKTFHTFMKSLQQDGSLELVYKPPVDTAEDETSFASELQIVRSNGEVRWVANHGRVDYGESGETRHMVGTVQDITDRKRTEIERQTLLEIMQGLAVTDDLPEFLRLVHHSISRLVFAENFFVVLLDQETGLFEEVYVVDKFDQQSPPSHLEHSLSAYVFRTGQPILINDPLFKSLTLQGEVELVGTDSPSWLGVPLKTHAGTIGVMAVQDYEDSTRYTPRDVDFLSSIAGQVALAVERKRSETKVARLSRQMESILSSAGEGIYGTDIHGIINFTNPAFAQMVRWAPAEMLGKSMHNLCHHSHGNRRPYPQEECPLYLATLEGKSCHTDEEVFWRRDGTSFPVELTSMPLRDGSQVMGTVVVVKDITERRAAEISARRWAERAELLASMPELFASPDLDYHASLALLARRVSTIIGFPCIITLAEEEETGALAPSASSSYQASPSRAASGTADAVSLVLPMRAQGKIIGSFNLERPAGLSSFEDDVAFLQEIADRTALAVENARLLEQVQRQNAELEQRVIERTSDLSRVNAELERAARAKDEFLASMSHELRTPLNAILTLTESLEEGIYGQPAEQQGKPLRTISESGHHLLNLINDILDLSKIEAGKLTIDIAPVDIDMVCQASLRLIAQQASKKNLQVSYRGDPAVDLMEVDGRFLKQMLVNLLSNAVKFTSPHGQIGLEVEGDAGENVTRFSVWDTGIGIPPEKAHLLFQPFVQIDAGLSRQYGGTGLGLALVYRMAELHGGSVSLESTPGKGSRFTISLPWQVSKFAGSGPAQAGTGGQVREPPAGYASGGVVVRTGKTGQLPPSDPPPIVLIAEDNPSNQDIYADYLTAKGYRVLLAGNGLEALERARESHPALVVMDIQMPTMDGLEAIRRMRADALLKDIPVIALTALAMPEDRERCLTAGAMDYLTKPVSLKQLLTLIGNYTRRARP